MKCMAVRAMHENTRTPCASLLRLREQESNLQRVVDSYACCPYTIPDHASEILKDRICSSLSEEWCETNCETAPTRIRTGDLDLR